MALTKPDIVNEIALRNGRPKTHVTEIVEILLETI